MSHKTKVVISSVVASLIVVLACTTLPQTKVRRYQFPKDAYIGVPKRAYQPLGEVRAKVDFSTLTADHEEGFLCQNYFNKAVADLLSQAKKHGGDGVIDVKSVVFLVDGRRETYPSAECSDEGAEGQVLTRGVAVKWIPEPSPSPSTPLEN